MLYFSTHATLNRTGTYYVGVGFRTDPTANLTWPAPIVNFNQTTADGKEWAFVQVIPFDYRLRTTTRAGFYYLEPEDRYDSTGLEVRICINRGCRAVTYCVNRMFIRDCGNLLSILCRILLS